MAKQTTAIELAKRTHPEYDAKIKEWMLYQMSAEGGAAFLTDENLFSHRLEDSEDFEERLQRAYYLNFCDTVPSMYNSYIFKEGVERPSNENLAEFRKNVDGKGTNISEFMKIAGYWSSVFGVVHILINQPAPGSTITTKRDQKENEQYPYARLIFPSQLKDWSVDSKGNFKWVLIENTYYNDVDPKLEREEELHYMLITPDAWEIQDENGEKVTFDDGSQSTGTNELGYIPLYTMYHKTGRAEKIGQSLLKDIVYINRIVFNWCSCLDEQIERQTFSQLVIPDDGSLADREESGETSVLRKIGTSSLWTFPAEAKHAPQFISPNVENLSTIWNLVEDHIKEIFRLSGLQGGTSDLYSSRSGRQSQYSFLGVNSALAEKSSSYQEAENQISMIALNFMGVDTSDFSDVQYPTKFDIKALEDEIDGIFKILERNFSPQLNKALQKSVARKVLPQATQELLSNIEGEIDAGTGEVLPIKQQQQDTGIKPEENGQGNTNSNLEKSFKSKDKVEEEARQKKTIEE